MKKLVTVLMIVAMLFSLSVNAFAIPFIDHFSNPRFMWDRETGETWTETEYVNSAEKREISIITDDDGKKGIFIDAELWRQSGCLDELWHVDTAEYELILTTSKYRDNARLEEITKMIEDGESDIRGAKNVGELAPSMIDELEKLKAKTKDPLIKNLSIDDLGVLEIFDVSLLKDGKEIVQVPEGEMLRFKLQTNFIPGDFFFVLVNCDGEGWKMVDAWEVDENGILTLTLSQICCMAFIVPMLHEEEIPADTEPNAPQSPQTGHAEWVWWFTGAVVVGCAALAGFGMTASKKRRSGN